jgi:hypothetical protein
MQNLRFQLRIHALIATPFVDKGSRLFEVIPGGKGGLTIISLPELVQGGAFVWIAEIHGGVHRTM